MCSYFSVDEYEQHSDCLSTDASIRPQLLLLANGTIPIYPFQNQYQGVWIGTVHLFRSDHEQIVIYSIQSRVTKQQEKRRRQRQRRREQKQRKGSQPEMDEELATQLQSWAVHEPMQTQTEEGCEQEQLNQIGKDMEAMLELLANDRIDSEQQLHDMKEYE